MTTLESHEHDENVQELVELLLATDAFVDDAGPGPWVWERIEAAITEDRPDDAAIPIASARSCRARRRLARTVGVAAAVTLAGGAAAVGAWGPLRSDDVPAAPGGTLIAPVEMPGADRALDALLTVADRAGKARSAPGAQVVQLVDATGTVVAQAPLDAQPATPGGIHIEIPLLGIELNLFR